MLAFVLLICQRKLRKGDEKCPSSKHEKVEVRSHKMQIERLSSFCWEKWCELLSTVFFRPLRPCFLYSIEKYWVFDHKFVVFFTTVYRTSAINKPLSPFSRQPFWESGKKSFLRLDWNFCAVCFAYQACFREIKNLLLMIQRFQRNFPKKHSKSKLQRR